MVRHIGILTVFSAMAVAAPRACVGSVALTSFRLTASGAGSAPLPLRYINNLPNGYRIAYQPTELPADMKKDAKLTLVVVPKAADGQITVLEPRLAANVTEWTTPFAPRMVLLVFAPQGLDEKRLTNLVTKDENLVAMLADYADQTAELEAGLQALDALEQGDDDFVPRASTPAEQAIFALVRALNPASTGYNPLTAGRIAGPATLLGKGVGGFFDNAGGIVPGGGVLTGVKGFLLPDTDFRSVFALFGDGGAMTLCSQAQPKSRNKVAYMWAYRLTNAAAPTAALLKDADVPIGLRSSLPVKLAAATDWRLLDHAFEWSLIPASGATLPVAVRVVDEERALQLDLRKTAAAPGAYRLQGKWDWGTLPVMGAVRLRRLDDFKTARLTPESQDALIAGTGPVNIDLTNADFVFAERASMHRSGSPRQIPVDVAGRSADSLRLEVDTASLRPGDYLLALARTGGATTELPLRLLPPPPRIGNSPRVNLGEREQTVAFTGSGLDRIEKLDIDGVEIALKPAGEDGARREAAIRVGAGVKAGDRLLALAKVDGMSNPIRFPIALQVAAPRPRIREAKASMPRDLAIAPRDGEIPAGSWVSFAMKFEPADALPALTDGAET